MYDLIIIGMGVSGISGAIYAKRAGLKVLLLDHSAPGGTLNIIPEIENYPGIDNISGPDLAMNLFNTVNKLGIEYKLEEVTDVILDNIKTVKTKDNAYQSKYILIASGRKPKMLGLKDEDKYIGNGISTCALCDGAFFKGKEVAVIGGGSSAVSEALYLSKIVKKVYLIHRREEFRAENTLIDKLKQIKNIELILKNEVTSLITDNNQLIGLKLKDRDINISGMFLYIGFIPNTDFLHNTALKLENGYIIVDSNGETNIEGVYAAGDVTKKEIYQIINAASEGALAAINISKN
ncbi:MAG: FAD-dependent oxidoreductase [Bacilli bacterium]|jgi:thioredoxin reductase (NADPH)|nr:FAD-dependent oxidoreductase [Bacilli bacterium]